VDPSTSLNDAERRKSYPYQDSNSDPLARQPITSHTNCAHPAPVILCGGEGEGLFV
jgi:hypothetical protein